MPFSVITVLAILALLLTVASAVNWCPVWVPVVLLSVVALLLGFGVK